MLLALVLGDVDEGRERRRGEVCALLSDISGGLNLAAGSDNWVSGSRVCSGLLFKLIGSASEDCGSPDNLPTLDVILGLPEREVTPRRRGPRLQVPRASPTTSRERVRSRRRHSKTGGEWGQSCQILWPIPASAFGSLMATTRIAVGVARQSRK